MSRYIDVEPFLKNDLIEDKDGNAVGRITHIPIDVLRNAPTADVEQVKHAYWIETPYDFSQSWLAFARCSNCHSPTPVVKYKYCPCCGAKMDGKETEK